ncbi:alpha/beta hydrolase fold [Musa troglodytarum]|uniref:Alpha/beta hydrolase fold n=1 Tax=Musa troglodytarum TaxID=320322 RepID=A0A9E7HF38_9LILI|nr:alpha/beta hydrolase fold [Musa troglodytarum]
MRTKRKRRSFLGGTLLTPKNARLVFHLGASCAPYVHGWTSRGLPVMELVPLSRSSISAPPINRLQRRNNLKWKQSQPSVSRKAGIPCAGAKPPRNSGLSSQESKRIENLYQKEGRRLLRLLEGLRSRASPEVCGEHHKYFAINGDVGLANIPKKVDEVARVIIPGLPDDSGGSPISSCYWEWKPKISVHYEKSGSRNVDAPAVLFLPGFGVGSFHYEKQLEDLGRDYRVWALDFLGQGKSLPSEDPAPVDNREGDSEDNDALWGFGEEPKPWARELVYSIDLWREQVQHFVEQVIGEPVYVVGNSLGGFVALYFAACNPQLVRGVALLNATPFWGFLPNPIRSPRLSKFLPWSGTLPLPSNVRRLTQLVWEKISDPSSIQEVLKQVYADHSINVDKVFSHIIEITQHPAAAASFASIMFAPRGQLSFQEALSRCQVEGVPICLMYGREDPWVRPIWGFQVKRQLPEVPYYEISPAGHCPHDEVPEVINFLLRGWIKNLESQGSVSLPLLEEPDYVQYEILKELEYVKEGSHKSIKVRFLGSNFSFWNLIISSLKLRLASLMASFR